MATNEVRKAGAWAIVQGQLGPLTAQKLAMAPHCLSVKFLPPGMVFKDLYISASSLSSDLICLPPTPPSALLSWCLLPASRSAWCLLIQALPFIGQPGAQRGV